MGSGPREQEKLSVTGGVMQCNSVDFGGVMLIGTTGGVGPIVSIYGWFHKRGSTSCIPGFGCRNILLFRDK